VRPEDGSVKPLFDTPLAKSDYVTPSPDGYFLAYTEVTNQKTTLKLLTPDGKTARELATFQEGSIYPIVWSPDSASLAFARITGDAADGQDVYVIDQDGRNLQQVYHSNFGSIYMLNFSPDGNYLLLQDYDAAGWHVVAINLSTLEQHMLQQVPGIPPDWWWMAPSWR
jgi:Tol biopolymer transport system component